MSATTQPTSKKGYKGLPPKGCSPAGTPRITAGRMDEFRTRLSAQILAAVVCSKSRPGRGTWRSSRRNSATSGSGWTSAGVCPHGHGECGPCRRSGEFRLGDAAAMPFDPDSFDFVFCQAAFKNFSEPVRALAEMHRVLKPGGTAVVRDLRKDATPTAIAAEVGRMKLGRVNTLITKWIFKHSLLKNAFTEEQLRRMVAETPFGTCEVRLGPVGFDVVLVK